MERIYDFDKYIKENVLFPRGGKIGGEHKKSISDKDFEDYDKPQGGNKSTRIEKFDERFLDRFGVTYRVFSDWINHFKGSVESLKDILRRNPEYFENNTQAVIDLGKKVGLNFNDSEEIKKFITEEFESFYQDYLDYTEKYYNLMK